MFRLTRRTVLDGMGHTTVSCQVVRTDRLLAP